MNTSTSSVSRNVTALRYGATPTEWAHFSDTLMLTRHLLPVVSNPNALISPHSTLRSVGKMPSTYNRSGHVSGLAEWTRTHSTALDVDEWAAQPDYGICVQTRLVRAFDIDIEDEALANEVVEAITQAVDDATLPMRYRSTSSKCLLAFTLAGEYTKRILRTVAGAIEFLADGQQFVACGTHPSGVRYQWSPELPEMFPPLSDEQFEDIWRMLTDRFGVADAIETRLSVKGQKLSDAVTNDPIAQYLIDKDLVLRQERDGRLHIECPWSDEHTADTGGNTSTTYWPAHTGGYINGHFRCLHAHCEHRTDNEFLEALGYVDESVLAEFEAAGQALSGVIQDIHAQQLVGESGPNIVRYAALKAKGLSDLDREEVARELKKVTRIRLSVIRDALRQQQTDGDGTTHHAYAEGYLANLERISRGYAPAGVNGEIYTVGDTNVWTSRGPGAVEVEIARLYDGQERCERGSDYRAISRHALQIAEDPEFFTDAPVGIATPQGFWSITPTGEIRRENLNPEHRQRVILPTDPAKGLMPRFEQFLDDTFITDRPGEAEAQQALLQEILGATLTGVMHRFEKVVLFYGRARAGKGTLLKIIEHLIPAPFRTASSPFNWRSEYYLADLAGKRLNVVGELPEDKVIPAAEFKTVSGRDLLQGRNPTGRPFTFRCEAAHVFNSNYLINTRDHSDAFFSRWLLLDFPNSRIGKGPGAINTQLADDIIREELPQILHWSLSGARRLLERGEFLTTPAHDRLMSRWRVSADSVMAFVHDPEACRLGNGYKVKRSEFYTAYRDWAHTAGRKPLGKSRVFETIREGAGCGLKESKSGEVWVQGVDVISAFDCN